VVTELRVARQEAGISQRALAAEVGWYQSELNRLELFRLETISIVRLAEIASVLGLKLSASLHPFGEASRDQGQQSVYARFRPLVAAPYALTREVPFPGVGDLRSWDAMLKLDALLVGVELETRVRDIQACVRKIRAREQHGGADEILLVLADTRHNRRIVEELRETLGPRYATPPSALLAALRNGTRMPGSGVILV
jgi:transcriptional regulator with XRE-family HTH domain